VSAAVLFQVAPRASALPLSISRHPAIMSDLATPHQQPPSSRQFEPQLDMARTQSWLIPYPCVPCDNAAAAAYHGFATNVAAAAEAAATTAARGLTASPKTTSSSVVDARRDHASVSSQPAAAATHQRHSALSYVAWSRDRPRPAAESSDFAGHLHDMTAAPRHPLKQVRLQSTSTTSYSEFVIYFYPKLFAVTNT